MPVPAAPLRDTGPRLPSGLSEPTCRDSLRVAALPLRYISSAQPGWSRAGSRRGILASHPVASFDRSLWPRARGAHSRRTSPVTDRPAPGRPPRSSYPGVPDPRRAVAPPGEHPKNRSEGFPSPTSSFESEWSGTSLIRKGEQCGTGPPTIRLFCFRNKTHISRTERFCPHKLGRCVLMKHHPSAW